MSAKKRRIKRKIERIVRMDRQARGCGDYPKGERMWANIYALAQGIANHGARERGKAAMRHSRKYDRPIYRPKLETLYVDVM